MSADYLLFPFRPERHVLESLEWRTDVLEAWAGAEQRIRLRTAPRQGYEMECMGWGSHERARMDLLLSAGHGGLFGLPVWTEMRSLAAELPAGSGSIPVSTAHADYRAGGLALLWSAYHHAEAVQVAEILPGELVLGAPTSAAHPARSLVMPLRLARLLGQYGREDHVAGNAPSRYRLQWVVTDNQDLAGDPAPVQYLGYEVLTDPYLLTGQTIHRQIERPLEVVDPGLGAWAQFARTDYPLISTEQRWRLGSRAAVWAMRRWLHRRAGRCNPVWIPTWRQDLSPVATIGAAATTIRVCDVDYRTLGLGRPTREHVAVMLTDGTIFLRRITDATAGDPGEEILTIDSALGAEIPAGSVRRISYLSLHRMAADRVEIAWQRAGVAEVRAAMVGVEQ